MVRKCGMIKSMNISTHSHTHIHTHTHIVLIPSQPGLVPSSWKEGMSAWLMI